MRRVDKLGRIVIPQELRKKYALTEGARVEFLDGGDGITVRPSDPFCRLCRARIADGATLPLCDACVAEVMKYNKKD